ncbi:MAG: HAD-IA family hydrolase [Gammaproteobacteria bacterium]|nr:HAD-IA family hydrolase [Gammaproteobacteria bacterium]
MIQAILFDLDGTLADTAPDLGLALNLQRERHGLPPLAMETIRPYASHGTRGLFEIGFGLTPEDARFEPMREEYLALYTANLCLHTTLFPGMAELLAALEARNILWGVVTNKPARFTNPLLEQLGLFRRAASVISGDTCPQPKPHPEPLLTAAREIGVAPQSCLYVGDAERDVEAAVAAGMTALIAGYGYLGATDRPETWGAHGRINAPQDILAYLV